MAKGRATKTLTKAQKIRESVKKTAWWWFGNMIFGLAPILMALSLGSLNLPDEAEKKAKEALLDLIKEGTINLFFLAVVGAIAVDIMLARKQFRGDFPWKMLTIAIIFTGGVGYIYSVYLLNGDDDHRFGNNFWLTIIIAFIAFCYCSIGKITLFLKEK